MHKEYLSTQSHDRIEHIDVIRGFAIFGILLVNMAHFSYPDLYLQFVGPDNFFTSGWSKADHFIESILSIFIQMKFIMLFSFLFGFGMILMMERMKEKNRNFTLMFLRRLAALFLFGSLHAFFIWDGDILTDYALLGFLLFLFRKRKARTLLVWAIIFYLLFAIPAVISTVLPEDPSMNEWDTAMAEEGKLNAKQALEVYSSGSFAEITNQRIHDRMFYMSLNGMATLNPLIYFFSNIPYFSMFLLGAYFAKRKLLHYPEKYHASLQKFGILSLLIGLPANILYGITDNELLLLIGAPFLMLSYMITITIIYNTAFGKKLCKPISAVGRTAFSNYILQSIIATTIFYHFGLGLYGQIYPLIGFFISINIILMQLVLSNIWLKHFRYGPLEWLWRTTTYMQLPKIR